MENPIVRLTLEEILEMKARTFTQWVNDQDEKELDEMLDRLCCGLSGSEEEELLNRMLQKAASGK